MADGGRQMLDALLDRQSRAWLAGGRPAVEELLAGSPLCGDADAELDLIYNEVVLREEAGEAPPPAEYVRRYPHLRAELELHFAVHAAVADDLLTATPHLGGAPTLPDGTAPVLAEPPGYELIELLGRGGMAAVYMARHRKLRRLVALKVFEPGRIPAAREVLRLRAEAEAVARLRHPNVVKIYEVGEWNGLPFLALELAEGGTLAQRLQRLPFTPRGAAELVEALAAAVQHAHDAGVVHRDLKPANVLFAADGTPSLTDFGLAKVRWEADDATRDATRTGDPIGTPRYMAPEQAAGRNEAVGPAADVYGLGNLLFECLTGRPPFLAAGVVETLDLIRAADPPSPRRFNPAVPRDLETICLHCLHKDPARRYPAARALAADLRAFLDRKPIAARPTPPWERAAKWCRRRPAHAALLAVAVFLATGGVAAAGVRNRLEKQRVERTRADVEALLEQGRDALARADDDTAAARFRAAWVAVQGEPALRDYETGVRGWLDHGERAANRYRWKQRVPPREYDARRDEALLLATLLDATPDAARAAVAAAREFALPDDPAWQGERELLLLLDAELVLAAAGPAAALARLDAEPGFASHRLLARRANYLAAAGRDTDAAAARRAADRLPPDPVGDRFFTGLADLRRRDLPAAAAAFDAVLDADPEHFPARLLAAVCAVQQGRAAEARVGLTACVAQRPSFAWAYVYRGRAARALGDEPAAARDLARAAALQPGVPTR